LFAFAGEAVVEADVAPVCPAELLQFPSECREVGLPHLVILGEPHDHADAPHPFVSLRMCDNRPCGRAGDNHAERAAVHSITSSARLRSDGGSVMSRMRAASALMTSSNFDGCTTGKSAGFTPLRMRPT